MSRRRDVPPSLVAASPTPGALRSRRHRERVKAGKAVGRYEIDEELLQAMVWAGMITDAEAMTVSGSDRGVAGVLNRFKAEVRSRFV